MDYHCSSCNRERLNELLSELDSEFELIQINLCLRLASVFLMSFILMKLIVIVRSHTVLVLECDITQGDCIVCINNRFAIIIAKQLSFASKQNQILFKHFDTYAGVLQCK